MLFFTKDESLRSDTSMLNRVITVIGDAGYKQWREILEDFHYRSRARFTSPFLMFELQTSMLTLLFHFERELKQKRASGAPDETLDLVNMFRNNLKSIADGLAWRLFGFNRAWFYYLGTHKNPGYITHERKALEKEIIDLANVTQRNGSIPLFCDLTNFIRVGDVVAFNYDDQPPFSIRESKSGKALDKRQRKQKRVREQAIKFLTNGESEHPILGKIKVIELPVKFQNSLEVVGDVIRTAEETGTAARQLDQYLRVSCLDILWITHGESKQMEEVTERWNSLQARNTSPHVIVFSNLMRIPFFTVNVAPYSVFPYNSETCVGLDTGRFVLVSELDLSEIQRLFKENGWKVDFIERFNSLLESPDSWSQIIPISRGSFTWLFPWVLLFRVILEFMHPEVLVRIGEELYRKASPTDDCLLLPNLPDEATVWQ